MKITYRDDDATIRDENGEMLGWVNMDQPQAFSDELSRRINTHDDHVAAATKWRELMEYIKDDGLPCRCPVCRRVFALAKAGVE